MGLSRGSLRALMKVEWVMASESYVEEIHTSSVGMTRALKARRYGKVFALKCLKPEVATDPLAQSLLHKEFEIGFSLNHPNVVSTQDFVEVAGLGRCIVMEWIVGTTFDEYIQSLKLKEHDACCMKNNS